MVCYTTMKAMADLLGPFRRRGHSGFAASGERPPGELEEMVISGVRPSGNGGSTNNFCVV